MHWTVDADLVVNCDDDQAINASCGAVEQDLLPHLTYRSDGLGDPEISWARASHPLQDDLDDPPAHDNPEYAATALSGAAIS